MFHLSLIHIYAKPTAIFMHCLPAFHDLKTKIGKEVYEKFGYSCLLYTSCGGVFLCRNRYLCEDASRISPMIVSMEFVTLLCSMASI